MKKIITKVSEISMISKNNDGVSWKVIGGGDRSKRLHG